MHRLNGSLSEIKYPVTVKFSQVGLGVLIEPTCSLVLPSAVPRTAASGVRPREVNYANVNTNGFALWEVEVAGAKTPGLGPWEHCLKGPVSSYQRV